MFIQGTFPNPESRDITLEATSSPEGNEKENAFQIGLNILTVPSPFFILTEYVHNEQHDRYESMMYVFFLTGLILKYSICRKNDICFFKIVLKARRNSTCLPKASNINTIL